ncbi:vacuolar ATP synthase proteolipid subunit [Thecamonas trahens ATCC 50062]|uniref:Vacuolar ATP synthase proteolipid subunit n=1 Tax=Thecamonas trahens ATCC 50062 TaxID=461836 RepID=A0A0L0DBL3_THETB|nr:vacuolar ATP synthase proteolipid subunit [Thecamonas trahens ATCC 50062]KNC48688.1 vacuolar ATP synthase proteolipid subunit [Thecamonas trahens ATCC 50062]|eukprot:XP_013762744.1 vacuolar ATP synthase proteolipid subunit [Thecamonas trahens ATCC 50062]
MATPVPCPAYAGLVGHMGVSAAIALGCLGSAYGTAKAASGIASVGVHNPASSCGHSFLSSWLVLSASMASLSLSSSPPQWSLISIPLPMRSLISEQDLPLASLVWPQAWPLVLLATRASALLPSSRASTSP